MCVLAPRCLAELVPVPLDLVARRVVDLDRGPALHPGTGLAVRAQLARPQAAGEALVAQLEPEELNLVEQRRGPHVRVVDEPFAQVGHEPIERIVSPAARPGHALADEMSRTVLRSRPR